MRLAQLLSLTKLIRRGAGTVGNTSAKRSQPSASAFMLESLESRLLLSATPVVTAEVTTAEPSVTAAVVTTDKPDKPDAKGSWSINDVSVREGDKGTTKLTFTVTLDRTHKGDGDAQVDWSTEDGTATTADKDYKAAHGTVKLKGKETSKTITVDVKGDPTPELDETFFVNLTKASKGTDISDPQGVGTIVNDDAATTTTTVTSSASPSTYGQAVTFTANVSASSKPSVGTVQFYLDGSPTSFATGAVINGIATSGSISTLTAGVHHVSAVYSGGFGYSCSTSGTITQNVNKATVTVAATLQIKVYGAADPALTYSASGFQFGDTAGTVLSGGLTRAAGEDVGYYVISQGTLVASGNYTISFTGNNLVITP